MCRDTVSIVRKKSCKSVYNLFMKMYNSDNELYKLTVIERIQAMAVTKQFTYRQAFILMVDPII